MAEQSAVDISQANPRWFVARTKSRHEKMVAQQLQGREVECLLPLYRTASKRQDRTISLEVPLFPGYIFVRIPLSEQLKVLQVPGVADFVGFGRGPCPVAEHEVEALRRCLEFSSQLKPCEYIHPGQRAQITEGVFKGIDATVVRHKGRTRLVVSIDLIMRSLAVELDLADVKTG